MPLHHPLADVPDFETIVVDNGSTDGSVDWLKDRCGNAVSTVALPSNLGFAGGNNAGIRSRGDGTLSF